MADFTSTMEPLPAHPTAGLTARAAWAAFQEDWQAHDRDPWRQGLWVMLVFRFGQWRYSLKHRWLRQPFSLIYKLMHTVVQILTGIELHCETRIGRRLRIEHFGNIIVSGDSVIGDDVILRQGVTIGLKRTGQRGAPVIGHRVDIGAGAKLLGAITIGDGAVIGANAVVTRDVPAGAVAVGIPARIIGYADGSDQATSSADSRSMR